MPASALLRRAPPTLFPAPRPEATSSDSTPREPAARRAQAATSDARPTLTFQVARSVGTTYSSGTTPESHLIRSRPGSERPRWLDTTRARPPPWLGQPEPPRAAAVSLSSFCGGPRGTTIAVALTGALDTTSFTRAAGKTFSRDTTAEARPVGAPRLRPLPSAKPGGTTPLACDHPRPRPDTPRATSLRL